MFSILSFMIYLPVFFLRLDILNSVLHRLEAFPIPRFIDPQLRPIFGYLSSPISSSPDISSYLIIVNITYSLTHSMVQSPSWAADWLAASQ